VAAPSADCEDRDVRQLRHARTPDAPSRRPESGPDNGRGGGIRVCGGVGCGGGGDDGGGFGCGGAIGGRGGSSGGVGGGSGVGAGDGSGGNGGGGGDNGGGCMSGGGHSRGPLLQHRPHVGRSATAAFGSGAGGGDHGRLGGAAALDELPRGSKGGGGGTGGSPPAYLPARRVDGISRLSLEVREDVAATAAVASRRSARADSTTREAEPAMKALCRRCLLPGAALAAATRRVDLRGGVAAAATVVPTRNARASAQETVVAKERAPLRRRSWTPPAAAAMATQRWSWGRSRRRLRGGAAARHVGQRGGKGGLHWHGRRAADVAGGGGPRWKKRRAGGVFCENARGRQRLLVSWGWERVAAAAAGAERYCGRSYPHASAAA